MRALFNNLMRFQPKVPIRQFGMLTPRPVMSLVRMPFMLLPRAVPQLPIASPVREFSYISRKKRMRKLAERGKYKLKTKKAFMKRIKVVSWPDV